jgi:pyruvate/2-oxoglutarate dehydrogenase complex dihydrolipoamide dehydrogenase (E3) component
MTAQAPLTAPPPRGPVEDFDVAVLGGGAAGLTASGIAASFGAKTLLVERAKLGGDCTWTGCIPSKTLLSMARLAHHARRARQAGLSGADVELRFDRVMEHVRRTRQGVYDHADAPPVFEAMGVDVRQASARFDGPRALTLTGDGLAVTRVTARRIIIATGGRPAVPAIPGLDGVPYLTSETIFELTELPARLAILGGGPIGCEMAQAFQRLGSKVTLIERGDRVLPKDDAQLAELLGAGLASEGVDLVFRAKAARVDRSGAEIRVAIEPEGSGGAAARTVAADALLVATGRRPNLEGLGLDAAGIAHTERGITVDARCRTSARHVYACGDVTGRYQLTHMSEHMAKIAATNALLRVPSAMDTAHVPWCTFTDPELAHVGATEAELVAKRVAFETFRFPYDRLDRAITEGETTGMLKVHATRWGKILGASVLGAGAGDLIGELAVAMRNGVSLRQIADTIHPYPTLGLGVRRVADQWYARQQSPRVVRLVRALFGLRGAVPKFDPDRIV